MTDFEAVCLPAGRRALITILDEAGAVYEHFQFIPFADQPCRLFLPMESIRQKTPPSRA